MDSVSWLVNRFWIWKLAEIWKLWRETWPSIEATTLSLLFLHSHLKGNQMLNSTTVSCPPILPFRIPCFINNSYNSLWANPLGSSSSLVDLIVVIVVSGFWQLSTDTCPLTLGLHLFMAINKPSPVTLSLIFRPALKRRANSKPPYNTSASLISIFITALMRRVSSQSSHGTQPGSSSGLI